MPLLVCTGWVYVSLPSFFQAFGGLICKQRNVFNSWIDNKLLFVFQLAYWKCLIMSTFLYKSHNTQVCHTLMVMGDTRAANGTNGNQTILEVKAVLNTAGTLEIKKPRGTNAVMCYKCCNTWRKMSRHVLQMLKHLGLHTLAWQPSCLAVTPPPSLSTSCLESQLMWMSYIL